MYRNKFGRFQLSRVFPILARALVTKVTVKFLGCFWVDSPFFGYLILWIHDNSTVPLRNPWKIELEDLWNFYCLKKFGYNTIGNIFCQRFSGNIFWHFVIQIAERFNKLVLVFDSLSKKTLILIAVVPGNLELVFHWNFWDDISVLGWLSNVT